MDRIRNARLATTPRIAVAASGSGEIVVFLHGVGGIKENWLSQLAYFGETHCAVAWDARGYGESDDYDGDLVLARDCVEDLRCALDALGATRAHLVGLSMGGMIAQCFYFAYPQRVASLVLADSFPSFRSLGEPTVSAYLAARLQPLLDGASPADLAPSAAAALLGAGASDEARARLIVSLSSMRTITYIKAIRALVAQDSVGTLEEIAAPTLVVNGEFDRLSPVSMAREMASRIPGASLVVIPGAGHLSNIERPTEFNEAVMSFLLAHPGATVMSELLV